MRALRSLLTRPLAVLALAALLLALAGCGSVSRQRTQTALDKAQYGYSAAIRWGDFEGAWAMVDPKLREAKPMSEAEFSRYAQMQVAGYRDLASMPGPDGTQLREIQIDVVNRNTLSQRTVRYTESWRWDEQAQAWWVSRLPDFWQGQ